MDLLYIYYGFYMYLIRTKHGDASQNQQTINYLKISRTFAQN
jgi:hypothetical protein